MTPLFADDIITWRAVLGIGGMLVLALILWILEGCPWPGRKK